MISQISLLAFSLLVKVNSTKSLTASTLLLRHSPIGCQFYLPNVRATQYKLGPERLTRLGNSNVRRLPVSFTLFCPNLRLIEKVYKDSSKFKDW